MIQRVSFFLLILLINILVLADNNFLIKKYCTESGDETGVIVVRPLDCFQGSEIHTCTDSEIIISRYENNECIGDHVDEILESNCLEDGYEYFCTSDLPTGYCYIHYYDEKDKTCESDLIEEIKGFKTSKCVEYEGNYYKMLTNNVYYSFKNYNDDNTCKRSYIKSEKLNECFLDNNKSVKTLCEIQDVSYVSEFYHDPIYSTSDPKKLVAINVTPDNGFEIGENKRCTTDNVEIKIDATSVFMRHCDSKIDDCYECSKKPEMINPVSMSFFIQDGDTKCTYPLANSLTEMKSCVRHPVINDKYTTLVVLKNKFEYRVFNDTNCKDEETILKENLDTCVDFFDSEIIGISVSYNHTIPSEETPPDSSGSIRNYNFCWILIITLFCNFLIGNLYH